MKTIVKKRDGRLVDFDASKIFNAVKKAFEANGYDMVPDEVSKAIASLCDDIVRIYEEISVEKIQDLVEDTLLKFEQYRAVAKDYIRYREAHKIMRTTDIDGKIAKSLVNIYIDRVDDMATNENASFTYSLAGLNNYLASTVTEEYWLQLLPKDVSDWHRKGACHLHDMGVLGPYCCGWDLGSLLKEGFIGGPGKNNSKPPKHFRTALGQLVNFLYTLQNEAAGAQAVSNFDTLLAPYVYYDGLSYEEVKQAIQEFIYNMNVPTRQGAQSPFTNITLDLTVPDNWANDYVIIAGEIKDKQYKDFQKEMDMINKALAEVFIEGDRDQNMFPYPIPTYNITKGFLEKVNPEVLEVIGEMTVKYGIPYFANYINSDLDPEDARSMCCRLKLSLKDLQEHLGKGGGFFGASPLTGSVAVGSVSLPYWMKEAVEESKSENKDEIFKLFMNKIKHAAYRIAHALEIRRKVVENLMEKGLYPVSKHWLESVKRDYGEYFARHFSTIGIVGFNEAAKIMGFKNGLKDPEAHKYAEEMLKEMKEYMNELTSEFGHLFNLEQTPAESASVKMARKSGIDPDNKGYYTNSTWYGAEDQSEMDMYDLVMKQGELNRWYTGGSALHLYLGENITHHKSIILRLIYNLFQESEIPYVTVSPVYAICTECHSHIPLTQSEAAQETVECPHCGATAYVYSRIVGYYRRVADFNEGRKEEHKRRYYYHEPDMEELKERALEIQQHDDKEGNEEKVFFNQTTPFEFKSISSNQFMKQNQ